MKPLVALILLAASSLHAGPTSYICEITGHLTTPNDLLPRNFEDSLKTPLTIDRMTGRVIHPALGNTFMARLEILDPGGEGWSFKVVARSLSVGEGHGHLIYHEVHEYFAGSQRPFLAIVEGFAFTGLCE